MTKLQKAMEEQLGKLPAVALKKLVERKLKEAEVQLSPEGTDALVEHLLQNQAGSFTWNDERDASDENRRVSLSFGKSDIEELEQMMGGLHEAMPNIVGNVVTSVAEDLFKELKDRWEVQGVLEAFEIEQFREGLEERWGQALDLLRMLLTICREMGADAHKRFRRSKSKRHQFRRFVLQRLHIRACQVADEIINLLENGFADGAMARWRTLHEISVIATLIETGTEDLAERYILHDAVDVKREYDEYNRSLVPLGYRPISVAERKRIEADFAEVVGRFGQSFKEPFGWAAERVKGKPTFKSLQEEAGRASMTSYYKLASYNVHAGARAMFYRLSDMADSGLLIAGRSNAGLMEPGQNTAFTLVQITCALISTPSNIERVVEVKSLLVIRDAIPKALARADRKLRRDEIAIRRGQAKRRRN